WHLIHNTSGNLDKKMFVIKGLQEGGTPEQLDEYQLSQTSTLTLTNVTIDMNDPLQVNESPLFQIICWRRPLTSTSSMKMNEIEESEVVKVTLNSVIINNLNTSQYPFFQNISRGSGNGAAISMQFDPSATAGNQTQYCLYINHSNFTNCSTQGNGGAIFVNTGLNGEIVIDNNCYFINCSALNGHGGGIFIRYSASSLVYDDNNSYFKLLTDSNTNINPQQHQYSSSHFNSPSFPSIFAFNNIHFINNTADNGLDIFLVTNNESQLQTNPDLRFNIMNEDDVLGKDTDNIYMYCTLIDPSDPNSPENYSNIKDILTLFSNQTYSNKSVIVSQNGINKKICGDFNSPCKSILYSLQHLSELEEGEGTSGRKGKDADIDNDDEYIFDQQWRNDSAFRSLELIGSVELCASLSFTDIMQYSHWSYESIKEVINGGFVFEMKGYREQEQDEDVESENINAQLILLGGAHFSTQFHFIYKSNNEFSNMTIQNNWLHKRELRFKYIDFIISESLDPQSQPSILHKQPPDIYNALIEVICGRLIIESCSFTQNTDQSIHLQLPLIKFTSSPQRFLPPVSYDQYKGVSGSGEGGSLLEEDIDWDILLNMSRMDIVDVNVSNVHSAVPLFIADLDGQIHIDGTLCKIRGGKENEIGESIYDIIDPDDGINEDESNQSIGYQYYNDNGSDVNYQSFPSSQILFSRCFIQNFTFNQNFTLCSPQIHYPININGGGFLFVKCTQPTIRITISECKFNMNTATLQGDHNYYSKGGGLIRIEISRGGSVRIDMCVFKQCSLIDENNYYINGAAVSLTTIKQSISGIIPSSLSLHSIDESIMYGVERQQCIFLIMRSIFSNCTCKSQDTGNITADISYQGGAVALCTQQGPNALMHITSTTFHFNSYADIGPIAGIVVIWDGAKPSIKTNGVKYENTFYSSQSQVN
ncbi:MAG: hypothetical protein EZS28_031790, partial [Streblomastix strix]